ncbi:hypothetical protein [Flexistipes sp.]|uniref:hypothetical protein n=1 Tax=Flexistipes sp. TaxID=3088135 RepID=UPI002E1BE3BB|nr:hypothetical protein [Flexistipes sp.]
MKHNEAAIKAGSTNIVLSLMLKILVVVVIVFTIIVIKQKYINVGYDISRLSAKIESKEINLQSLQEAYNALADKDRLYKKGKAMGMKFPENTKVYYVE